MTPGLSSTRWTLVVIVLPLAISRVAGFAAESSPAPTNRGENQTSQLQGRWHGTVTVVRTGGTIGCLKIQKLYQLTVDMVIDDISVDGTGQVFFDKPSVTKSAQCKDMDIREDLVLPTAPVHFKSEIVGNQLSLGPPQGTPPLRPYREFISGQENTEAEDEPLDINANITDVSGSHFSIGWDMSQESQKSGMAKVAPLVPGMIGEYTIAGSFSRVGAAARSNAATSGELPEDWKTWLAALLAYLALILPSVIMNPKSADFMGLFGSLVGSLEALKKLGFATLVEIGKVSGFAGAAVAEAWELARIYVRSQRAGESGAVTAVRLAASAIPDFTTFAGTSVLVEAGIGVAATAAPLVGTVGAAVIAAGGVAAISYVGSKIVTQIKDSIAETIDKWVEARRAE